MYSPQNMFEILYFLQRLIKMILFFDNKSRFTLDTRLRYGMVLRSVKSYFLCIFTDR